MRMKYAEMENLKKFLRKKKYVRAAYLFGSMAERRGSQLSDIDIAAFIDDRLGRAERNRRKILLINAISSILKTDRIDLVIMNDSPLMLNYNIVKTGKVLKSGTERVMLETAIMSEYLDRKYYDDLYIKASLARISRMGIV